MYLPTHQSPEEFTRSTMMKIHSTRKQRRIIAYVGTTGVALGPLAMRKVWFLMRGDYFSISAWPMSHSIAQAYSAFLSPLTGYVCVGFGLCILTLFVIKKDFVHNFNRIAH
jgi:hypothetical protein